MLLFHVLQPFALTCTMIIAASGNESAFKSVLWTSTTAYTEQLLQLDTDPQLCTTAGIHIVCYILMCMQQTSLSSMVQFNIFVYWHHLFSPPRTRWRSPCLALSCHCLALALAGVNLCWPCPSLCPLPHLRLSHPTWTASPQAASHTVA